MLAIETSTEACSAALYYQEKIISRYILAPQQHASLILTMCQELLDQAGITQSQLFAVAFGCGPGSFTGIRIAASVAQGIAIAHDLPVIPVSSLQILAQASYIQTKSEKIIAGIDARMNEVYLGKYSLDKNINNNLNYNLYIMKLIDKEMLINSEEIKNIILDHKNWDYSGSAFQKENIIFPRADAMIAIALHEFKNNKFVAPENALPVYLRNEVVKNGTKSS